MSGDTYITYVQKWLNNTYADHTGYTCIEEDGFAGNGTCIALVKALQIELGLSVDGGFGNGTCNAYDLNPITPSTTNKNLIRILQGGFYCKGIDCNGFDGVWGAGVTRAVLNFKEMCGRYDSTNSVDSKIMKALLNTDSFLLASTGKSQIRTVQQFLNATYADLFFKSLGLIPCDGVMGRSTAKGLAYALQKEENLTPDGVVGTQTLNNAPILSVDTSADKGIFIKLAKMLLTCMYKVTPNLDPIFDLEFQNLIIDFQEFMCLDQQSDYVAGTIGRKTWAALLLSKGDMNRSPNAFDCATRLTNDTAFRMHEVGGKYVGRYLTGTSKNLTSEEINIITNAGLNIFPIFQTTANTAAYFTYDKGYSDAGIAIANATDLKIPYQEHIYFAVDCDLLDKQLASTVIPYFQGIKDYFSKEKTLYKIGIYASRHICSVISEKGLATSSFVGDASTGYSGNMGYPMPENWAFDQYVTDASLVCSTGTIKVDKDIASGRNLGFNRHTKCGHDNYRDVSLHMMELDSTKKNYICNTCNYSAVAPTTQDADILTDIDYLRLTAAGYFFAEYLNAPETDTRCLQPDMIINSIDAIQSIRFNYINQYEFSNSNGYCLSEYTDYYDNTLPYYGYASIFCVEITDLNYSKYSGMLDELCSSLSSAVLGFFVPEASLLLSVIMSAKELIIDRNEVPTLELILESLVSATKEPALDFWVNLLTTGVNMSEAERKAGLATGDFLVALHVKGVETIEKARAVFNHDKSLKYLIVSDRIIYPE